MDLHRQHSSSLGRDGSQGRAKSPVGTASPEWPSPVGATSESRTQLSVRKASLLGRGKACLGAHALSIPGGAGVEREGASRGWKASIMDAAEGIYALRRGWPRGLEALRFLEPGS